MENTFNDLDLEKAGFGLEEAPATPAPEATPAPAPEVAPVPEVKAPVVEPKMDTPAPTPQVVPAPVETETEDDEVKLASDQDPEVQAIIRELQNATSTTDESAKELSDKAKETGDEETVKLVNDLTDNLTRERILREKAEKEATTYKDERGKTLDEKNAVDLENKQKARLYGVIDSDELLQSIVAYSYKAKEDPTYRDKLITAAKELLKREGEDVDAAQARAVTAEKSAMGDMGNATPVGQPSAKPEDQSIGSMFETI